MAKKDFIKKTASEIQAMWEAYQENPTTWYVARKANCTWKTAAKYIKSEKMEQRMLKINSKALTIADNTIAKRKAKTVKIAESVIAVFAQSLIGHTTAVCNCGQEVKVPIPRPDINAADFDRMVRLIREELGVEEVQEQKIIIEYVDKPIERDENE